MKVKIYNVDVIVCDRLTQCNTESTPIIAEYYSYSYNIADVVLDEVATISDKEGHKVFTFECGKYVSLANEDFSYFKVYG